MTDPKDPTAARTARELAHAEMQRRILDSARSQLATVGPAQLSLRAIARELGVVSSAIYRYVANRDELLTRLILQSFTELGDVVERAAHQADTAPAVQWHTWAQTLRDWAHAHPHDWALIYGIPVPGYAAPTDTIEPARRVNQPILALYPHLSPDLEHSTLLKASERALAPLRDMVERTVGTNATHGVTTAMMLAWSGVHGFIALELGGHFHGSADDCDPVFAAVVEHLGHQLAGAQTK